MDAGCLMADMRGKAKGAADSKQLFVHIIIRGGAQKDFIFKIFQRNRIQLAERIIFVDDDHGIVVDQGKVLQLFTGPGSAYNGKVQLIVQKHCFNDGIIVQQDAELMFRMLFLKIKNDRQGEDIFYPGCHGNGQILAVRIFFLSDISISFR